MTDHEDTLAEYFAAVMAGCRPSVRDAIAAGLVGAGWVQRAMRAAEAVHGLTRPHGITRADLDRLGAQWDEDMHLGRGARLVFASITEPVPAPVVALRRREGRGGPGALVVKVRCPFAAEHTYRPRGHQFHLHSWPLAAGIDMRGALGVREPHCYGNTRTGIADSAHVELLLPAGWLVSDRTDPT